MISHPHWWYALSAGTHSSTFLRNEIVPGWTPQKTAKTDLLSLRKQQFGLILAGKYTQWNIFTQTKVCCSASWNKHCASKEMESWMQHKSCSESSFSYSKIFSVRVVVNSTIFLHPRRNKQTSAAKYNRVIGWGKSSSAIYIHPPPKARKPENYFSDAMKDSPYVCRGGEGLWKYKIRAQSQVISISHG